jgi:hypothetical protein
MPSQAHLDALAQQQGFKNYAQWSAWNQRTRQPVLSGNPTVGPGNGAPPQNWLQHLLGSIPIHPMYLLNKVNDAFDQAGQGPGR